MHWFDDLLKDLSPPTFNPKVMPDPTESERLAAKLREAHELLRAGFKRNLARRAESSTADIDAYASGSDMSASMQYGRRPYASW